jgi:4a-hydroxytetrahydrobiopterin dehydratase
MTINRKEFSDMNKLTIQEIDERLKNLPDWYLDQDALRRDWQFKNFAEALQFINQVGGLAEKHDHHPEIFNVYNKVNLRFNTHFVGGITRKDFDIAAEINRL